MAIIPRFYMNAVVSIGVMKEKEVKWVGTGFFVLKPLTSNQAIPFMVTNKHVILGFNEIFLRFRIKDSDELKIEKMALYNEGIPLFKLHPSKDVDIAVIALNGSYIEMNRIDFNAFDLIKNALNSKRLMENGVEEGSLIYMLGYPMGLVNEKSQLPFCRLGCIARISETQINEDMSILADIQNFPGNSGSPVVTRPEIISIEGTISLNQSVLIGIVHSYYPYQEELVNKQTGRTVEIRSENSGIARIHPVEYIQEIIDNYDNL